MTQASANAPDALDRFETRWVFGAITDAFRRQLVAFWTDEGAIGNPDEAWRRTGEVACVLQHASGGNIAGICTVAIALDDHGRSYGFLRIYIAAGNRHAGLNVRMMRRVIEGFEAIAGEAGAPKRLVATVENRKIEGRGGQRLLAGLGFESIGRTPRGELLIQRRLQA